MKTLEGYIRPVALLPIQVVSGDQVFAPFDTKGQVAASGAVILTTIPLDGTTVTVGDKTYTYKDTLSSGPAVAYEVLIGANVAATRTNLKKAINDEGTAGTHYATGTVRNGTVTAGTIASATIPLTARAAGNAGNSIPLSTTSVETSNSVTAFSGGRDGEQYDTALVRIACGNIVNTPDSLAVIIQESDTADFASVATVASQTVEADTVYTLQVARTKKFIRAKADFTGGSSPTAELHVDAILCNWAIPMPVQA